MTWPANDALYFKIGERIEVGCKDGTVVRGRVAARSVERVWLVGEAGWFAVGTGAVSRISRLS